MKRINSQKGIYSFITILRLVSYCFCVFLFSNNSIANALSGESLAQENITTKYIPVISIKGAIGPAVADYLVSEIARANQQSNIPLIVLTLDTPGGLSSSLRVINQAVLASDIPLACLVYPEGARAASAGTYLLYACHLAAMAPATTLGAATPVAIGSMPGANKEEGTGQQAMEKKVLNDAVAYIRSLAQLRNRNSEWAELAVREAATLTAQEALEIKVINFIAASPEELLLAIEQSSMAELGFKTSQLQGAQLSYQSPDWRHQVLATITNPNIAYILMLIGVYGLLLEFYSPGIGVAGVVGALSLIVALYSFQLLPVNYAGMALIVLGIGLLVAESLVPSFGILGFGGVAAFVMGSVMLFDSELPQFQLAIPLIASFALVSVLFIVIIFGYLWRSRNSKVVSGQEAMLGEPVSVINEFSSNLAAPNDENNYFGDVLFEGEHWSARSHDRLIEGQQAIVLAIDGLVLTVKAAEESSDGLTNK